MTRNTQAHTERPMLGVVIPLANEATTVNALLSSVRESLHPGDTVFCILDTVSTDDTRRLVQDIADVDPAVRCVWSPENRCVVDAYLRGYREALAAGCEWILEMDAGGSHDPRQIPLFLTEMQQGADFAAGCRFAAGGSHVGNLRRRIISRGGTWLANLLLGTQMSDMCSGFECFHRSALQYVLEQGVRSRGHFFQTEIRFHLRNWNWVEVPICYRNPDGNVGQSAIREALRNLWWLRSKRKEPRDVTPSATTTRRDDHHPVTHAVRQSAAGPPGAGVRVTHRHR